MYCIHTLYIVYIYIYIYTYCIYARCPGFAVVYWYIAHITPSLTSGILMHQPSLSTGTVL